MYLGLGMRVLIRGLLRSRRRLPPHVYMIVYAVVAMGL